MVCEMFEDSTDQAPIATQTLLWPVGSGMPAPPGVRFWSDGAWQDLQGAIRFTMVSGSVTVTSFDVSAVRNEFGGFTQYASTVVPEPCSLALFYAFAAAGLLWRSRVGPS
jgi:hypothetical protein